MARIKKVNIRKAVAEDLNELLYFADRSNDESSYKVKFCAKASRAFFKTHLDHPVADIYVAEYEGSIVGGVMMAYSLEFHEQPFCYVNKFWVSPMARGSDAGRQLLQAVLTWAKHYNCSHVFTTATAGLDEKNQQLFINLMKKGGMKEDGPVLFVSI